MRRPFVALHHRPDGTLSLVYPHPRTTLEVNLERVTIALGQQLGPAVKRMAADMSRVLASIARTLEPSRQRLDAAANAAPRIAGLEARYYMRGALDLDYATPEALHSLVRRLLAGDRDLDPDLALVAPENRRAVAVAAMRGWEERGQQLAVMRPCAVKRCRHQHRPAPPLIAHRAWPLTRLEVRCG